MSCPPIRQMLHWATISKPWRLPDLTKKSLCLNQCIDSLFYVVSKMKGFFGRLLHPGRPLVKLALSRSLCSMSFRYLIFIDSFVVQFMGQVAYSCLQGTVARTCSKIGWEERKCKESARLELAPSSVQAVALSGLSNPIRYSWHLAWICLCSLCSQMFEWCQQRVPIQRSHLWCRYECTLELEFRIDAWWHGDFAGFGI